MLVVLPHQFYQMRECAVSASLVDSQKPDEHIHVAPGRQGEEVFPPGILAVGVLHDDLCDFRSVDGVLQVARVDGIEAVRVQRVIEVHNIHLRQIVTVAFVVIQQLVHYQLREVRILVVIHEERVPLLDHLPDIGPVDGDRLAGAGRADDHRSPEGVHYVDVAPAQTSLVLIGCGDIDAETVLDELLALRESIVLLCDGGKLHRVDGPAKGDIPKQVQPISYSCHHHVEQSVPGRLPAKEKRQPEAYWQGNFLPLRFLGAAASNDDGIRAEKQDDRPYIPPVSHQARFVDAQHQRICHLCA